MFDVRIVGYFPCISFKRRFCVKTEKVGAHQKLIQYRRVSLLKYGRFVNEKVRSTFLVSQLMKR